MLGSRADAEDAVQDVWLRWQATPADRVQTAEAWLVATTTRLCVDRLRSRAPNARLTAGPGCRSPGWAQRPRHRPMRARNWQATCPSPCSWCWSN
nr:sigma factor [Paracidovorax cattleyae]